jgi:hypothetical protein
MLRLVSYLFLRVASQSILWRSLTNNLQPIASLLMLPSQRIQTLCRRGRRLHMKPHPLFGKRRCHIGDTLALKLTSVADSKIGTPSSQAWRAVLSVISLNSSL